MLRRRVEVDVQQQATAECTRRSSSGALLCAVVITFLIETSKSGTTLFIRSSQLGVYVDDDEGTHQPRAVVVLWYTETAQVD